MSATLGIFVTAVVAFVAGFAASTLMDLYSGLHRHQWSMWKQFRGVGVGILNRGQEMDAEHRRCETCGLTERRAL